jgi:invasion protein IalB
MLTFIKNIFLFLFLLILINPVMADNHVAVEPTQKPSENSPNWSKICETIEENKICQISFGQIINNGDQTIWLSRVGIVELNEGDKKLFIHSPLGVKLQDGVLYQIDDNQTSSMQYHACFNVQGCQALLEVNDTMIQQLKDGQFIKMRFIALNGKSIAWTIPLAGFTKAYND